MHKIISKQIIASDIKRIEVTAETISRKMQAGQFVMVKPDEKSENIPLTIIDADPSRGIITLIFQEVGLSTRRLGALLINDSIFSILGPLGNPAPVTKVNAMVGIGYGVSAAQFLPVGRAFKKLGSKVIAVIGAPTRKSLILESQMRIISQKLYLTTDDGSYERRGSAADVLREVLRNQKVDLAYATGPVELMKQITQVTSEAKIKTWVNLNPVMMDGIGLCGSCRVRVGGTVRLTCTDGPVFDGHTVDFEELAVRMKKF